MKKQIRLKVEEDVKHMVRGIERVSTIVATEPHLRDGLCAYLQEVLSLMTTKQSLFKTHVTAVDNQLLRIIKSACGVDVLSVVFQISSRLLYHTSSYNEIVNGMMIQNPKTIRRILALVSPFCPSSEHLDFNSCLEPKSTLPQYSKHLPMVTLFHQQDHFPIID